MVLDTSVYKNISLNCALKVTISTIDLNKHIMCEGILGLLYWVIKYYSY